MYTIFHEMQDAIIKAAMPYPEGRFAGRGIVICAGGTRLFTCAWVCISLLRSTVGCKLPIQVWYLGPEEMDARMIGLLETLDVACIDAYQVRARHPARRLGGWESKPYAIIHSPFQEVMLLDADNVPIVDPTFLFETAAYAETGAIFWPDRSRLGPKTAIWEICRVPYRDEPAFESGQIVVDKARCWKALQLTLHLNEYSDFYYRHVYGDKDTFHMAWRMLDQPYSMPPYPSRPLWDPSECAGGPWEESPPVLCQHDFEGRVVFQHRTRAKWVLHGVNPRIPRFQYYEECLSFLWQLSQQWDGRGAVAVGGSPCVQAQEWGAGHWFLYVRVSSDQRLLEFLPDHRIGCGSGRCERSWRLIHEDGSTALAILGDDFVTCRLTRDTDDIWKGRWLHFERMPIELIPLTPDDNVWLEAMGKREVGRVIGPASTPSGLRKESIDVVYLHVYGQDPAFQETLSRYTCHGGTHVDVHSVGAHRFRDNGELRYLLRSLEIYAPWIRHIYFVTNGQVPAWLDTAHPRISVIVPEAIFPDPGHLPTFNSHAIELHLHRIPGLSDRFIYFNDDMFLGNFVFPEDFLTASGGQKIYFDAWSIPTSLNDAPVHDQAYAYTQYLLDERFGKKPSRGAIAHIPRMFDRTRIIEIQEIWDEDVIRTSSHRFRIADDLAFHLLYFYYLLEGPERECEVLADPAGAGDYCFLRLEESGPSLARRLHRIASLRPKFFCINDDRRGDSTNDKMVMQYKAFLHWYFRRPSSFEHPEGCYSIIPGHA